MRIHEIVWLERFRRKFESKHGLSRREVEQVIFGPRTHFRVAKRGLVRGEMVFAAYGRTKGGRRVVVFFIYKQGQRVLPISARDMSAAERRYHDRQAP